ncbi:hypothetical protein CHUUTOTORO_01390 [Serratia phage vB_SmaM-ChuuTotoro]|nr:hypothetical protein CHUUTOTORO_01390 [Serratia phage vB_SmaM-ChuuTotoro]
MGYLIYDHHHGWYLKAGFGYTEDKEEAHVFDKIPSTAYVDLEKTILLNSVRVYSSKSGKLVQAGGRLVCVPELVEALEATLEWIDAVPQDTELPTMPGFDRDWVDNILNKAKEFSK